MSETEQSKSTSEADNSTTTETEPFQSAIDSDTEIPQPIKNSFFELAKRRFKRTYSIIKSLIPERIIPRQTYTTTVHSVSTDAENDEVTLYYTFDKNEEYTATLKYSSQKYAQLMSYWGLYPDQFQDICGKPIHILTNRFGPEPIVTRKNTQHQQKKYSKHIVTIPSNTSLFGKLKYYINLKLLYQYGFYSLHDASFVNQTRIVDNETFRRKVSEQFKIIVFAFSILLISTLLTSGL